MALSTSYVTIFFCNMYIINEFNTCTIFDTEFVTYSFIPYLNFLLIKENLISQKMFYLCMDNLIFVHETEILISKTFSLILDKIFSVMYEVPKVSIFSILTLA